MASEVRFCVCVIGLEFSHFQYSESSETSSTQSIIILFLWNKNTDSEKLSNLPKAAQLLRIRPHRFLSLSEFSYTTFPLYYSNKWAGIAFCTPTEVPGHACLQDN